MVFTTAVCFKRVRGADRFWKRALQKRLAWHMFGRRRNCYRIGIITVRRSLRFSTINRKKNLKQKMMQALWVTRIKAACGEHGVEYSNFMKTLEKSDILLDRRVLADLAIYEPRTFQSLCKLVEMRQEETGLQAATLTSPSGVLTRGML